jgi:spore germination protein YaaH
VKRFVYNAYLITAFSIILVIVLLQCKSVPANQTIQTNNESGNKNETEQSSQTPVNILTNPEASSFKEVWAYVVAGSESALSRGLPLTDIGYFSAEIDTYGKLSGIPRRTALNFPGRVHLVVKCDSRSLTYFVLRPDSQERQALISDLLTAARNYDGLQIDMELVPQRSAAAFLSFLQELRKGLPQNKMFTICLPARTRKIADDVYDYENIKPIVDRIFVMAYDEHWSGSNPGSVASLDWCKRVAEYSLRVIGREKLIMGLPFYGRAWGNYSPSRALIHSTTERIINENNVKEIRYENGIPTFDYNINVSIKVYYENEKSLSTRMNMYRSMNINLIGFWRLGQETKEVWNYIKLE